MFFASVHTHCRCCVNARVKWRVFSGIHKEEKKTVANGANTYLSLPLYPCSVSACMMMFMGQHKMSALF